MAGSPDSTSANANPAAAAARSASNTPEIQELTAIVPLKPGKDGAPALRQMLSGGGKNMSGADQVGVLHNMRFVIFDNDTKLMFATAYDGDWDSYIDDFATKIPQAMDYFFSVVDGWPGIAAPTVKEFIRKYQIPATGWYVAYRNETVSTIKRGIKARAAIAAVNDALNKHDDDHTALVDAVNQILRDYSKMEA